MSTKFGDLPQKDQDAKLATIYSIAKDCGLESKVVPEVIEQIVCSIKSCSAERNKILSIEGECPDCMSEQVKKFNQELKDQKVMENIDLRSAQIEVTAKPGSGDPFREITEIVDVDTSKTVSLAAKPGQAMLIDFWATWCPPCQAPMAHNQKMLEEKGATWGDKVRIIGISIDQTADVVVKHVADKGWKSVEHFHRATSDCSKVYGVNGVPHILLIDGEGKIAYAGHPSSRNLEQDLDDLAAGKKLSGIAGGDSGSSGPDFSGYDEMDGAKVTEQCDAFEKGVIQLGKDEEVKKNCDAMQRDMCVMVCQAKYDGASQKFRYKFQNINVLVGQKAQIDSVKPKVDAFLKGIPDPLFKTVDRIQAM